jgi:hypothetical protein
MRLRDRPTFRASVAVPFRDFDAAWQAVRHVSQSDLWPANCRLLNPTEALLSGAGDGSTSVVLLGFESADHPVEPLMARAAEICASFGGLVPVRSSRRQAGSRRTTEIRQRRTTPGSRHRSSPLFRITTIAAYQKPSLGRESHGPHRRDLRHRRRLR